LLELGVSIKKLFKFHSAKTQTAGHTLCSCRL